MSADRLTQLQDALQAQEVDCLALVPGPALHDLTGLDLALSERPLVLFVPAEGAPAAAIPASERAAFGGGMPFEVATFTYDDEEGPESAFMRAVDTLPEIHQIAVERARMRVLAFDLIRRRVPNAIVVDAGPLLSAARASG